jgi:hypothetical protein
MGEVIWLHERKPKALLQSGSLLAPREGQPIRSKETKGEVVFTSICGVILLACAGYFTFVFTQTPLP